MIGYVGRKLNLRLLILYDKTVFPKSIFTNACIYYYTSVVLGMTLNYIPALVAQS